MKTWIPALLEHRALPQVHGGPVVDPVEVRQSLVMEASSTGKYRPPPETHHSPQASWLSTKLQYCLLRRKINIHLIIMELILIPARTSSKFKFQLDAVDQSVICRFPQNQQKKWEQQTRQFGHAPLPLRNHMVSALIRSIPTNYSGQQQKDLVW